MLDKGEFKDIKISRWHANSSEYFGYRRWKSWGKLEYKNNRRKNSLST
jgi:hypothetical protein